MYYIIVYFRQLRVYIFCRVEWFSSEDINSYRLKLYFLFRKKINIIFLYNLMICWQGLCQSMKVSMFGWGIFEGIRILLIMLSFRLKKMYFGRGGIQISGVIIYDLFF